jgi:hypothetical protein
MAMAKNLKGRTRPQSDPYEVITQGDWTWKVLKHYQSPEGERSNPYARVFLATTSPYTFGSAELSDGYIDDVPDLRALLNDQIVEAEIAEMAYLHPEV